MATELTATEKPDQNPILWVARPMATAARQFVKSLFRPSTIVYPFERLEDPKFRDRVGVGSGMPIGRRPVWDNYRGVHALNIATCISCNLCAFSCPDLCIEMVTVPGGDPKHPKKCPEIDYGKCSYCGFCSDACPEGCLTMTTRYELSVTKRSEMVYSPAEAQRGVPDQAPDEPDPARAGRRTRTRSSSTPRSASDATPARGTAPRSASRCSTSPSRRRSPARRSRSGSGRSRSSTTPTASAAARASASVRRSACSGGLEVSLEELAFLVLAVVAVVTAIAALLVRELVHTILWIAVFFVDLSAIYFLLEAPFLGVLQLGVYAGAVTVLLLVRYHGHAQADLLRGRPRPASARSRSRSRSSPFIFLVTAFGEFPQSSQYDLGLRPVAPLGRTSSGPNGPWLLLLGLLMLGAVSGAIYLVREGRE